MSWVDRKNDYLLLTALRRRRFHFHQKYVYILSLTLPYLLCPQIIPARGSAGHHINKTLNLSQEYEALNCSHQKAWYYFSPPIIGRQVGSSEGHRCERPQEEEAKKRG